MLHISWFSFAFSHVFFFFSSFSAAWYFGCLIALIFLLPLRAMCMWWCVYVLVIVKSIKNFIWHKSQNWSLSPLGNASFISFLVLTFFVRSSAKLKTHTHIHQQMLVRDRKSERERRSRSRWRNRKNDFLYKNGLHLVGNQWFLSNQILLYYHSLIRKYGRTIFIILSLFSHLHSHSSHPQTVWEPKKEGESDSLRTLSNRVDGGEI